MVGKKEGYASETTGRCSIFCLIMKSVNAVVFLYFFLCFLQVLPRRKAPRGGARRRPQATEWWDMFRDKGPHRGRRAATNLDRFSDTAAQHQQCPDVGFVYSIELYLLKANTSQIPFTCYVALTGPISHRRPLTITLTSQHSLTFADLPASRKRVCQSHSRIYMRPEPQTMQEDLGGQASRIWGSGPGGPNCRTGFWSASELCLHTHIYTQIRTQIQTHARTNTHTMHTMHACILGVCYPSPARDLARPTSC